MAMADATLEQRQILDQITAGTISALEQYPETASVKWSTHQPADPVTVSKWEQRFMVPLTEDLKEFFLTVDGFRVEWNVKLPGRQQDAPFLLGILQINSLAQLNLINVSSDKPTSDEPSLCDLDIDENKDSTSGRIEPRFDDSHRLFVLSECRGVGIVCLVYVLTSSGSVSGTPSIWFLDRGLVWSYLASTFTVYLRMLCVHLGLPHWQYLFTESGISPLQQHWFNAFAPHCFPGHQLCGPSLSLAKHVNTLNIDEMIGVKKEKRRNQDRSKVTSKKENRTFSQRQSRPVK